MEPREKTDDDWRKELSREEYDALRNKNTEAPFSGKYVEHSEQGVYRCKACGNILFTSDAKFDSGSGWPAFSDPALAENVGTRPDNSYGMHRTEVFCKNCDGHIGHVFEDGPKELGGKRYCVNSVCLDFDQS